MTAAIIERAPGALGLTLRAEVRARAAQAYQLLRDIHRRELSERANTILDYHLAALRHFLATDHGAPSRTLVGPGCCVLLDRGEGGEWYLLADLPFEDPRVIASDSALGRALLHARPGGSVEYPTPSGICSASLLAVESLS